MPCSALEEGVIDRSLHDALVDEARATYFVHRTYPHLVDTVGLPPAEARRFLDWVRANRVRCDRKRSDAIECLRAIGAHLGQVAAR